MQFNFSVKALYFLRCVTFARVRKTGVFRTVISFHTDYVRGSSFLFGYLLPQLPLHER